LEHANNVSYLRWLEWITRKHNTAFGLGQDFLKASGTVFVVVDYQLEIPARMQIGRRRPDQDEGG
jgi:acyl-CoA thioesterase FadM